MSTAEQRELQRRIEQQERDLLAETVSDQVLRLLGTPADLREVRASLVWNGRYRVNVFVGSDLTTVRVTHSFFVTVDGAGNIVASDPKIIRHY